MVMSPIRSCFILVSSRCFPGNVGASVTGALALFKPRAGGGPCANRPVAAAAAESGDRACVRQAELRRDSCELSCAEAAIREGGLARRHLRLHEGPDAHRAGSR